jgi:hypothetical protein
MGHSYKISTPVTADQLKFLESYAKKTGLSYSATLRLGLATLEKIERKTYVEG